MWLSNALLVLNAREWAIVVWVVAFFGWTLSRADIRQSYVQMAKAFAHWKVALPLLGLLGWTIAAVLAGGRLGPWTSDLTKDTAEWMIAATVPLYFSVNSVGKEPHPFRRRLADTVRASAFIEFFINLYVFSFPVELILVPFVTLLAMTSAVAQLKPEYRPARVVLNVLLATATIALVWHAVTSVRAEWGHLDVGSDVRKLVLPIWLTAAVIPYLFLLSLYSTYEGAYLRLRFASPTRRVSLRVRLALLLGLHLRPALVAGFGGRWLWMLSEAPSWPSALAVVRRYAAGKDPEDALEENG